jgi:integrase
MTMQVFVDDAYTMIAAPVQCDVDGIPKGSHFARVPPVMRAWIESGVRPIVQEALGHSTIAITMDLYSHLTTTLGRDAARTIGTALLG